MVQYLRVHSLDDCHQVGCVAYRSETSPCHVLQNIPSMMAAGRRPKFTNFLKVLKALTENYLDFTQHITFTTPIFYGIYVNTQEQTHPKK